MAPITKLDDFHPAVSLMLIKPAPKDTSTKMDDLTPAVDPSSNGDDQTSRAALMQMIFALLLVIGENMSKMQKAYSQSQMDLVKIADAGVRAADQAVKDLAAKLAELKKQQEEAKKWQLFGTIMKWVGVAVALIVGALLCETGIGFAILVAAIAFTTIPTAGKGDTLFDRSVTGLTGALEKAGLSPEWAKILAEIIVLAAVVVVSCGTEAASAGISRAGATAGEEAAEDAASAAATKAPFVTAASTQAIIQVLTTSGLIPQLLDQIPGIKKYPWLVALLSVLLTLLIMVAAMKVTPTGGGGSAFQKIIGLLEGPNAALIVRGSVAAFVASTQAATAAAHAGQSYNLIEQGDTQKGIAPIQERLILLNALMKILVDMETLAQQNARAMLTKEDTLFGINFSGDMKGCITAQIQG